MSQTDPAMSNNVSILPTSGEPRRNPSMEFEPEWLDELRVNTSAVKCQEVSRHAVNVKNVWAPYGE